MMMIHLSFAPGFLGRQRDNCNFTRHLPGILISRKSRNCCGSGGKAATFLQNFKGTQVTTESIYINIYVCVWGSLRHALAHLWLSTMAQLVFWAGCGLSLSSFGRLQHFVLCFRSLFILSICEQAAFVYSYSLW